MTRLRKMMLEELRRPALNQVATISVKSGLSQHVACVLPDARSG
jgi:hypothetical protein